jgi:pimeloyl-ACP methyl ester carboxylesterase
MSANIYQAKRIARSEFIPIRHQQYHVHVWGTPQPGVAPLVMVHGWMDVGASFQFVVDALAQERHVIAPDWRGFGLTTGAPTDHYWFADYLADLDFLLDHYAGDQPVDLVGHSMGGNVVMQYAGARPKRIRRLVNLEGFSGPVHSAELAPSRYGRWMDELKALHNGTTQLKGYADAAGVAQRLMKNNPRLGEDRATWLAQHWARPDAQGQWQILGDPAHKIVHAYLPRVDELLALYRQISMPLLAVQAEEDSLQRWWGTRFTLDDYYERLKQVPQVRREVMADAGHMLHHDQPQRLAELLDEFLR